MERKFSRTELQTYDGQNGKPVYISYNGDVYDVSNSPHWIGGSHYDSHPAGIDLTIEIEYAPHGEEVFQGFPKVGILED